MGSVLLTLQLIQAIFATVHSVETMLPGAPGADKSQHVIDKVTPIATVLNANANQLQAFIDAAVAFFKMTGIFKSDGSVAGTGGFSFGSILGSLFVHPSIAAPTITPTIAHQSAPADSSSLDTINAGA